MYLKNFIIYLAIVRNYNVWSKICIAFRSTLFNLFKKELAGVLQVKQRLRARATTCTQCEGWGRCCWFFRVKVTEKLCLRAINYWKMQQSLTAIYIGRVDSQRQQQGRSGWALTTAAFTATKLLPVLWFVSPKNSPMPEFSVQEIPR